MSRLLVSAFLLSAIVCRPAAPVFATETAANPQGVVISLRDEQVRAAGIETHAIEEETETGELIVPGVVAVPPRQLRIVAAPAAGLVETLLVAPDEDVKEGAPIARLKSSELVAAQRAFLQAIGDANLAAEKLRRDEQLFKERIIAERRLLVTRAEAVQARSVLDERRQLLVLDGMTEEDIETLRKERKLASSLVVRAPMAGTILKRHGTAGERVPDSAPLVTIARLDPIWVNLQIPTGRAAALESTVHVTLPSVGAEGRLVRIGRTVDPATQSITAVAEFKSTKGLLRPGQAVQAILQLRGGGGPQWRVPADAVVHHQDQHWVFVRVSTGFRAQPVTLVAETPQHASVRGALKLGDRVATRGILTLLAELAATDK
jgi:cobalt-zinc-cadmium efflux system membrane fusion protein